MPPGVDTSVQQRRHCLNKRTAVKKVLALTVVLVGCSSGSGNDGGADGSVPPLPSPALSPLQACRDRAQALAAHEEACLRLDSSDEASFIAALCPADSYAQEMAGYDAGLLAYSQTAVSCNVAFYQTLGCNFPTSTDSQCGVLAWGVVADGGTCGSTSECQNGFYCQRTTAQACGACQPASAISGPCGVMADGAICYQGQCDGTSCVSVVGVGGMCQYDTFVCQPGLSCQIVCQAPGPLGSGCATDSDCVDGLTCQVTLTTATCATRTTLGQPCDQTACTLDLGCGDLPDGGTSCQPLTVGGPCVAVADGGLCKEAEYCNDGGCLPLGALGQTCGATSGCGVGQCLSSSCTLAPANTPCDSNEECLSQRCDPNAAVPSCVAQCAQ